MSQVIVNNGGLPVAPAGKSIRGQGDYHPRACAQVFGALQNFLGGLMVSYLETHTQVINSVLML